jgi:hypothetical protein
MGRRRSNRLDSRHLSCRLGRGGTRRFQTKLGRSWRSARFLDGTVDDRRTVFLL